MTCHQKAEILKEACFLYRSHLDNSMWPRIAALLNGTFVFLDPENMTRQQDFYHMLPRS